MFQDVTKLSGALVAGLLCAGVAQANHPVVVEGNCLKPFTDATPLANVPIPGNVGAACGDFDGDGLIGEAEDNDGDLVFGTIAAALAEISQNGLITVVTSGTFPEVVTITGNVTLEAAPGVSANIEAFVRGEVAPETGPLQGAPGIVVNAPANRQVVLRNLTSRNWTDGVRITGDSRVMVDNVRVEHNINNGIVVSDNARVAIVDSRVSSTGHRVNPGTGDFPSMDFAPAPGDGISFLDNSEGIINSTVVTGSFRFGMNNGTGNADALFVRESSAFDNGDDFSPGFNFNRFR
ncbi:MAG: right-handed parallel beta-helix repeat-containing protein [Oceanococcaceae bacterium]